LVGVDEGATLYDDVLGRGFQYSEDAFIPAKSQEVEAVQFATPQRITT
jgi:hypothetical protein